MSRRSYLGLIPRGLEQVVLKIVRKELSSYHLEVKFIGDPFEYDQEYIKHLYSLIDLKKKEQHPPISASNPVGSVRDAKINRHMSVGYRCEPNGNKQVVVSHPGVLEGVVWFQFHTDAPANIIVNQLRCIGPLLSLINAWDDSLLNESLSLEEATAYLHKLISSSEYPFSSAQQVWYEHVQQSWPLNDEERFSISQSMKGDSKMKFRLSCARAKSDQYEYTRQQFLASIVDELVPPAKDKKWIVDLNNYEAEVVILVQPQCLAIGFALRPYRQFGTKGFAAGIVPPDTTPPYLTGNIFSKVVRLRPTTAHILLHLAQVKAGDVVLDPCAGIGTIPLEVRHFVPALALGGDVALTKDGLAGIGASYASKVRQLAKESKTSGMADLLAWDAVSLPLRSSSVDIVVTDLPFGKQCLSSSKLEHLLPLMLGEMARVLRKGTGRMLLLCGGYLPVLKSLHYLNSITCTAELSRDDAEASVWRLPCTSVFPINIGGLLAWVVQVERGDRIHTRVSNYTERARKIANKREHAAKHRPKIKNKESGSQSKYRRLQS